jgi:hypothetical protein
VSISPQQIWGAQGGRTRAANLTKEQRTEGARKAHLASAVAAIVRRTSELTPDQLDRLRATLDGAK